MSYKDELLSPDLLLTLPSVPTGTPLELLYILQVRKSRASRDQLYRIDEATSARIDRNRATIFDVIMPGETPEKGDKVSWNWGGGAPGGKVAETKEHGEIAIQSKRGNTIKKNAEPDNPAVHIERSGNDVVKRASELNVEQKASTNGKKREHKEDDDPVTENAQGKDVKKAKTEKKSTKSATKNTKAAKKDESEEEPKEEEKEEKKETKATEKSKDTNGESAASKNKAPGRPKKGDSSGTSKAKKEPKARSAEGIGSRTRSRAAA